MELELASALCAEADRHNDLRPAPAAVEAELAEVMARVDAIADASTVGTHADYFKSSRERYAHYAALAKLNLAPHARVLDVGNAPGHFAFLLAQILHRVTGVNLNARLRRTYSGQSFDASVFTEAHKRLVMVDSIDSTARCQNIGGKSFGRLRKCDIHPTNSNRHETGEVRSFIALLLLQFYKGVLA
jgi:SAM-dependent methyltransferase